jgi:hypothetical protein
MKTYLCVLLAILFHLTLSAQSDPMRGADPRFGPPPAFSVAPAPQTLADTAIVVTNGTSTVDLPEIDLELPPGQAPYAMVLSLLAMLVVNWIKQKFPTLDPRLIVLAAPALSAAAAWLTQFVSRVDVDPAVGFGAGLAGIGIFELSKQLRKGLPQETPEAKKARLTAELAKLGPVLLIAFVLTGCSTSPERQAHTAHKVTLDMVYTAGDAWLDSFILRATPYRVTNAAGRVSLDLGQSPKLSHEFRVVDEADQAFKAGATASINSALVVKALAGTNGLSAEAIRGLNESLSATATNFLFLIQQFKR